jgi:hypothetical protein
MTDVTSNKSWLTPSPTELEIDHLRAENKALRDGIRALAESCEQRAQLAEYDAESASQCNDLWRGRAQEGKRVAARLRALQGEKP